MKIKISISRNPATGAANAAPGHAAGVSTPETRSKERKILGLYVTTRVSTDKTPRPPGAKLRKRNTVAADTQAGANKGKGLLSMDTLKGLVHFGGTSSKAAGDGKGKGKLLHKKRQPSSAGGASTAARLPMMTPAVTGMAPAAEPTMPAPPLGGRIAENQESLLEPENPLGNDFPPGFLDEVKAKYPDMADTVNAYEEGQRGGWKPTSGEPSTGGRAAPLQEERPQVRGLGKQRPSGSAAGKQPVTPVSYQVTGSGYKRPPRLSSVTGDPRIAPTKLSLPLPPNAAAPNMPRDLKTVQSLVPPRGSSTRHTRIQADLSAPFRWSLDSEPADSSPDREPDAPLQGLSAPPRSLKGKDVLRSGVQSGSAGGGSRADPFARPESRMGPREDDSPPPSPASVRSTLRRRMDPEGIFGRAASPDFGAGGDHGHSRAEGVEEEVLSSSASGASGFVSSEEEPQVFEAKAMEVKGMAAAVKRPTDPILLGQLSQRSRLQAGREEATPSSPTLASSSREAPVPETDAEAIARLRRPTPEPERARFRASLGPNQVNTYSEEAEIGAYQIEPPLPAKTRLVSRPEAGFDLEVDRTNDTDPTAYLEFIPRPKSDREAVAATTQAIREMVENIRQIGLTGRLRIPLAEAIPGVDPELARGRELVVKSLLPTVNYHTTFGPRLIRLVQLLDFHPNYDTHVMNLRAGAVSHALETACGEPPSEALRAFIKFVIYYLDEAQIDDNPDRNIKSCFNYLLRADFRAIYKLLLNDDERGLARVLCTPWREGQDTLFSRALGRDGKQAMMAPYLGNDVPEGETPRLYPAPALDTFLTSIVGPEGEWDALTRMPGNKPDWGLGVLGTEGIDRENMTVRTEARAHTKRSMVPANHFMNAQSAAEFEFAAGFAPEVLGPRDPGRADGADAESWAAALGEAMHLIGEMHVEFINDVQSTGFPTALANAREWYADPENRSRLSDLRELLDDVSDDDKAGHDLADLLEQFHQVLRGSANVHPNDVIEVFNRANSALWSCHEETSGSSASSVSA